MIGFAGKFSRLPGYVLGLDQPVALGGLTVAATAAEGTRRAADWLAGSLDAPLPELDGTTAADPALALVTRILQWCAAVQRQCRIPVSQRFHVRDAGRGNYAVALPCFSRQATLRCLEWAVRSLPALADPATDPATRLQPGLEALRERLHKLAPQGVNNYSLITAALDLGMPVRSLAPGMFALGSGARSRWFYSSITDATPSIGVTLAANKDYCARILRQCGLPAPAHFLADSADEAVRRAAELGYPVVVKPADMEQGHGVAADLRDAAAVRTAFAAATAVSKRILVEKHAAGFTHRLTVFRGRLLRVVKRVAGGVTGDGVHDIAELMERAQQDPLRQRRRARTGREALTLDDEALGLLAQEGLTPASVPAPEVYVRLRRRDNINAGGVNVVVPLEEVHADNCLLALRAATALRLDFAGIDLIIPDIRESWLDGGGVICEVNSQPQMGATDIPEIYRELLADWVGESPCIPVHVIVPTSSSLHLEPVLAAAQAEHACHALATPEGLWLDGKRISLPFSDGFTAAAAALGNLDIHAVICVLTPREIVAKGLPAPRVDSLRVVGLRDAADAERRQLQHALQLARDNVASPIRGLGQGGA